MIKLDDNLLNELGLGALPKEEKAAFLRHMYETLEMRVGTRLAERMNSQQMAEFEQFISTGDEQGAFKWLEMNFPDYKQVVAEEFEKLKDEVRPVAGQIVAASQQQQHALSQQQYMPQQPMQQAMHQPVSPQPMYPPQQQAAPQGGMSQMPSQAQQYGYPAQQPPQPNLQQNPMAPLQQAPTDTRNDLAA